VDQALLGARIGRCCVPSSRQIMSKSE
jgi:hypothetical protein